MLAQPPDSSVPESLQAQLDAKREAFNAKADEQKKADYDRGVAYVAQLQLAQHAVKKGQQAPNFTLPDPHGQTVQLRDLLQKGPVIITWYRGGWCPYCNLQLRAYQAYLDRFEEYDATLVAISPETPDNSLSTQAKNELEFLVLSDTDNGVAREYGLVYTVPDYVVQYWNNGDLLKNSQGNAKNELPLAATYLIAPDGTVAYAYLGTDYRERAEPAELLAALAALNN